MLNDTEIKKLSRRYMMQTVGIVVLLSLATMIVSLAANVEGLVCPLVVSVAFALVVDMADSMVWSKIHAKGEEALSTFFSAVSGFRMLLALATLTGCYIVVGRGAMLRYCIVFLAFYLALMLHHSIFFTRMSNSRHVRDDNEK